MATVMKFLFVIALLIFSSCITTHSVRKTWDANAYKNNSRSQFVAAERALSRISLEKNERILDVGCGDGKITAQLAEKVQDGTVVGIDLSPAMVDFARANFTAKNLSFEQMDAMNINYIDQFDTIVSFSAMQWVTDQRQAIGSIFKALRSNGRFLMMIPAGYPEPLDYALSEMMSHPVWQTYFQKFDRGQTFHTKEEYLAMLKDSGFTEVEVELIPSFDRFENEKSFSNFVRQWLPHLKPIPKEKHDEFMDQLIKRYLAYLPAAIDGSVWFNKYSLEALAKRS